MSAHYDLKNFREICGSNKKHKDVRLLHGVLESAQKHYDLSTKEDVLYSIDSSLQGFNLDCSIEWDKNPRKEISVPVDSYNCWFNEDKKQVYLAFMYISYEKQWAIKSFHPTTVAIAQPNFAFAKLLGEKKE